MFGESDEERFRDYVFCVSFKFKLEKVKVNGKVKEELKIKGRIFKRLMVVDFMIFLGEEDEGEEEDEDFEEEDEEEDFEEYDFEEYDLVVDGNEMFDLEVGEGFDDLEEDSEEGEEGNDDEDEDEEEEEDDDDD